MRQCNCGCQSLRQAVYAFLRRQEKDLQPYHAEQMLSQSCLCPDLKLLKVFMLSRCSCHWQMRSVDWVKDDRLIVKVLSFSWQADKCWNISRVCSFCDCHTVNIQRESVHCMESFHLRWWKAHFAKLLLQNFVTKPANNLSLHVCRFRPSWTEHQRILPLTDFKISRCVWLLSRSGCTAPHHSLGDLTSQMNFVIFIFGFRALVFSKLVWVGIKISITVSKENTALFPTVTWSMDQNNILQY